jgi:hypothetical protein
MPTCWASCGQRSLTAPFQRTGRHYVYYWQFHPKGDVINSMACGARERGDSRSHHHRRPDGIMRYVGVIPKGRLT